MFRSQTVFYPAISLKALSLWNCTPVGTVSYLTVDLSLTCAGSQYVNATIFNIFFVVGVVVGWPAFLIWYLRRVRLMGRTADAIVLSRVGFLFEQVRTPGLQLGARAWGCVLFRHIGGLACS